MTVKEIVEDYLKKHGYDGLYQEDLECACLIEDLFPCETVGDCLPGYKGPCDCGDDCRFHIYGSKEAANAVRRSQE